MNYLDIIIALLLIGFGFGGWRKGIIIEVTTLLALGVGLYGAFHFSDFTANKLLQYFEIDLKYLHLISFLVTFIVLSILVNLLGKLISNLVKAVNLGFIDKIGGFVIGSAKGLLICSLLIMMLNVLNLKGAVKEETKKESILYPWVERAVPYVYQGFDIVKEAIQNASDADSDADVDTDDDAEPEESDSESVVI